MEARGCGFLVCCAERGPHHETPTNFQWYLLNNKSHISHASGRRPAVTDGLSMIMGTSLRMQPHQRSHDQEGAVPVTNHTSYENRIPHQPPPAEDPAPSPGQTGAATMTHVAAQQLRTAY